MNIFVLCTGRCGSTTFIRACSHITNYSARHESRTGCLGANRFKYPDRHIEADNRLSWMLGRLDRAYGDSAFYLHLMRDSHATARSFVKRFDSGIMKAYRNHGILMNLDRSAEPLLVALDYCDTVNENIRLFLKDKTRTMEFGIEDAKDHFEEFCSRIGAEVDVKAAIREFEFCYNASR